jgi:predicted HNH restriction endonuclease
MQIYRTAVQETRDGWNEPSKEDYFRVFQNLSESATKLFKIQASAPGHGITTRQMAALAGFRGDANLRYGKACRLVSEALKVLPAFYWHEDAPNWWSIVSDECNELQELVWVMRPNAVEAARELGWESSDAGVYQDPTEGGSETYYTEGRALLVPVTIYERNQAARLECIRHYQSWACQICEFDFCQQYGEIGKNFIHVHHLTLISERQGEEYTIDPCKDLIPVCPNCHAMLHKRKPSYTPEELKKFVRGKA